MFLDICKTIGALAYAAATIVVTVAVARHYPGNDFQHAVLPWLTFYGMGLPAQLFGDP